MKSEVAIVVWKFVAPTDRVVEEGLKPFLNQFEVEKGSTEWSWEAILAQ